LNFRDRVTHPQGSPEIREPRRSVGKPAAPTRDFRSGPVREFDDIGESK
jgi:hypothetical protein